MPRSRSAGPRRVTIVVYPGVQALDLTGPHEVFHLANRFAGEAPAVPSPPYEVEVVARRVDGPGTIRSSSGLRIGIDRLLPPAGPDGSIELAPEDRAIDTVLVVGGNGTPEAAVDPDLRAWLRAVAPTARRVASVCSGAFILAGAGLLDGKRATTHWSECDTLRVLFPTVEVDDDPIFVKDGSTYTSAGITAGMDLALALVEEDLGRDVALTVSRWLVMFVQRPGGQSQFSSQLARQLAERQPLRDLQSWISDHPAQDLSVDALAARVAMSPRHFARVFRAEVGTTPAQYVEEVRVEVARRLLETTDLAIEQVARDAGFGTVETLQRSFRRRVHVTPRDYRRHFVRAASPDRAQARTSEPARSTPR
jgi:transcriptional regulator GlxA family with amidase domain